MTASTLAAAAEAGDAVADGGGWTGPSDGGGADDFGDVGAEVVSVVRGMACGDGAAVCDDEAAVCGGFGRIDVEAAPAAPPVAICTPINAAARIRAAAASTR